MAHTYLKLHYVDEKFLFHVKPVSKDNLKEETVKFFECFLVLKKKLAEDF